MSGIIGGPTPTTLMAQPTTVPATPDRSSSEVDALAAKQRAKFSAPSSFTKNYFGGGSGADVSTVSRVLGGSA